MGGGNKRAALSERGNDLYETPPEAVWALLEHERLPFEIWEPACGPGSIVRVLRAAEHSVFSSDLVDYGWFQQDLSGADFLMEREAPRSRVGAGRIECIVTNPPYKLASQFAQHALDLCPRVCMLLRLAFITAGNKNDAEGRARRAVLDGGHLARVLVFRRRLPMMHRDGWTGPRVSSQMDYAWFVWDREHRGDTTIKRISWEPLRAAKEAA
ncbi:class I SAM-dependent methyltransferase [Rhodomicrobium lacus]|uniref:class I SAM-dependent methyltransferase n=1 Tax=Rhodomicrobium lacus TaxID=2498452 RepID=UPI000F8F5D84|nr:class I SAM-dependent methyltransferase [Rhodomicrobium lacus]